MRRCLIALLFAPLAFAANPATVETRSQQHSLTVDVIPVGDSVAYAARVTDLASGELLASVKFEPGDNRSESVSELRDLKIRIRVRPSDNGVAATVEITKGDTVIDSMDARWTLRPSPATRVGGAALHLGGDVKPPQVMHAVEPQYPEDARKARIAGIVIIEALIDKSGTVRDVHVLKALPFGLDQAALEAVRQWKFKPATLKGEPVDVFFNVTINFKLDHDKLAPPPSD